MADSGIGADRPKCEDGHGRGEAAHSRPIAESRAPSPRGRDPVRIIAEAAGGPATDDPVAVIANAIGAPASAEGSATKAGADPYAAFWRLWTAHQSYLRKQTLRLMSGNLADAEDALSNAMLKALQKFDTYAGAIVNERAWLTRLVHNVCMDLHRSNQRIARSIDETVGGDFETSGAMPAASRRTPEDETLARRELRELAAELERMPRSLREPLLMRVLDDKSYDEISRELNLSNCAVRKRIQLARDFLRKRGIR